MSKKRLPYRSGKASEQAQRRGFLALSRLQPFDGEECFDGTVDHLATNRAMVVLSLLDLATILFQAHAALQTVLTAAAETG